MPLPLIAAVAAPAIATWTSWIAQAAIGFVVTLIVKENDNKRSHEITDNIEEYMDSHANIYRELGEQLENLQENEVSIADELQESAINNVGINAAIVEAEDEKQQIIDKATSATNSLKEKITELNAEIEKLKNKPTPSENNTEIASLKEQLTQLTQQLMLYKKFEILFKEEQQEKLLWKNRCSMLSIQCKKLKQNHLTKTAKPTKQTSSLFFNEKKPATNNAYIEPENNNSIKLGD